MCTVKIINQSSHPNPAYQTDLSAGMDLHANIEESISLIPGSRIQAASRPDLRLVPFGQFDKQPRWNEYPRSRYQ